ncbi:DM13 domain-containing protein [Deinococcus puniceus]|uniref:DM13 domain-containing protein n=1 Tax=Deinococcus puniceus TaxID=1182568 RepID=UPI0007C945A4|nr:DM13 domain-containing protein [Deinococcus puniceus]
MTQIHFFRTVTAALALTLTAAVAQTMTDTPMKDTAPMTSSMSGSMKAVRQGNFRALEAPTQGKAALTKTATGYTLTLTGLKTEPGPDLKILLFAGNLTSAGANPKVAGKYLQVGELKKFSGNFTYKIASKDLAKYTSVVIWCDQAAAGFAIANLK